jgi:hypothetical protein
MNSRERLSLLVALPITWLLFAAPLSARDEYAPLHDARVADHSDGHDQPTAQHADGRYLLYAEQGADQDSNKDFAAYQRTRNDEEQQGHLDRERQDSRERNDNANRYYWWWPFRR